MDRFLAPAIGAALLLLALLAGAAGAAWIPPGPGDHALARWPGRIPAADARGIDVVAYHIELDLVALPPQTAHLEGACTIRLRLLEPPPAELRLDLVQELAVSAVLRDGEPVAWVHAGDSLRVALPAAAAPQTEHVITISYAGSPPRHGPYRAGLLIRTHGDTTPDDPTDDGPSVGNVSQPYSSHAWFPCKDHPADKATVALSVTAPDSLTVVATCRLLASDLVAPDRRRWDWATDYPVAPYLVGLAVSNYSSWHQQCGAVPLEFHVFPEHREVAEPILAPTCAMLEWLSDLVGPYPFAGEKYAQAEFVWGGAMENQTVTLLGQVALLMPVRTAQLLVVHELAHHWFGNSLTPAAWRDIWLNEGFARYTEALWLEHTEGRQAYLDHLALLIRHRPHLFVGDGLLGDPDPVLPNPLVYDKGAWVLHMLRHELGDQVFFSALRDYATSPQLVHGLTDRQAMTASFSHSAGRDLAPWLAPWLDTDALPEIGVRWRALGGGRALVEVVQEQGEPFFPLTVPVRVHAGPDAVDLRLTMRDLLAGAEVTLPAAVDSVQIDPAGWLLRRTAATRPPGLLAAAPRPNPALGAVDLAYWLAGADHVAAAVYDVRGRLVVRRDLGAQPATGPQADGGEPLVWTWDGRDAGGRRAAAGIYWLELRAGVDRTARKVTLLR
jgi:aminopeptidase N